MTPHYKVGCEAVESWMAEPPKGVRYNLPFPKDPGFFFLANMIDDLINDLNITRFGKYGVKASDITFLASETGIKNNPVDLEWYDLEKIPESWI